MILLDVQMPRMDGFETAELIRGRERSRSTPIIFLTAVNTSELHIAKGYLAGAVDYLLKPFFPKFCWRKWRSSSSCTPKTAEVRQQAKQLKPRSVRCNEIAERKRDRGRSAPGARSAWSSGARAHDRACRGQPGAATPRSPSASAWRRSSFNRRRWKASAGWLAVSRTISTTC